MRVLVDECVDWRLSRVIAGHEVKTARQIWSSIRNGALPASAARVRGFDVFATVDRNPSFQQNLPAFAVGVIILRAGSSRLAGRQPLVSNLRGAIPTAKPEAVAYVGV